ncbi:MAG: hypothetical protein JWP44_5025 [Mucilaginibacter sp.]|nr:hypothetical protein [Mucilaginibacter sp.]
MSDLNLKSFYNDVITHLEEIEALYEEHEFEEDDDEGEEGSEEQLEHDALKRFINHIRDATEIAESY